MPRVEAQWRPSPVWLFWLLIVLALAVALAIFTATRSDQPGITVPPITSAAEPITSYLTIADARQQLALVGRRVVLKDVPVDSFTGGRLLWAGEPGRDVAVLLSSVPPGPLAPQVQIAPGQSVNITGNVKPAPSGAKAGAMWNLSKEQVERLAGHAVYIAAESITVVEK